ncbi:unnamed protein product [Linum tenue]|uniref:Uncharacterized protein n=1 Tax=Linum tenue TaxID=586396 RepID=A0AAV0L3B4_9ROSI|nr:unnamed protein product [Linum tenue]
MAPFDFKSNKHFVASSDGVTLQVYELTKLTLTHPSSIRKTHWRKVANINTNLDGGGDDDNTADETRTYDGLVFFDGHGKIEGREALTKLAQHLKRLSLMVSPGGHCFQDVNELGGYVDFGLHYLRLNDLFSWPHHGVDLARTDMWRSSELKYHDPRHSQRSKQTTGGGSTISMEKYKELKRLLTEKDEKLVNLKEEMDDELQNLREKKEDELQELREEMGKLNETKEEELQKLRKEKDEELRKLSKKKDVELQMLRKGKDGGAILQKFRKEKDDELRKLKNEMGEEMEKMRKEKEDELEKLEKDKEKEMLTRLTEKEDELQKLKKEKDEELQKLKNGKAGGASLQALRKEKDEEIENLKRQKDEDIKKAVKKKEAETLREKDEELRKLRKEKEDEIQKLTKQKDEEIRGKPVKYSDEEVEDMKKELAKLRDELSSSTVKCSSVLSPGGKVLYGVPSNEEWAFHVSHRRPVPPETFWCFTGQVSRHNVKVFYLPDLTEPRLSAVYNTYHSVDEGIAEEWLAPYEKWVHTETSGQGQFDVNNWWFAKTSDPEGGTTMMAYYYGDRYCIHHSRWGTIRIPFPNGVDFNANRNFYMGNLCGKIVFCFTFRN